MDPSTHRRFLDYLELWMVFGSPDLPKLDQASFAHYDAEYRGLVEDERAGQLDQPGVRRMLALRKVLLRD